MVHLHVSYWQIFDLLCEDVDGTKFILEMQNCPQRYFFNRGLYYLCRMVSRQGKTGRDWQYGLLSVYGIYLLNFSLPEFHNWRTDVILADEATGKTFGEVKLKQIYLSFDLFNLTQEECKTPLENWIYILKNMNLFDMSPFKEKEDAFRRLLDVANLSAMTDHERAVYEENLKIYRDWRVTLIYAVEEAEKKGKAEEQRLIAANFKKQGINSETIAQCTGLSVEEIDEL